MWSFVQSVEDVWIVWLVCVCSLFFWFRHAARGLSFSSCRQFLRSETGASYALPFVLTFPIYLLLMAVLLQASLILLCKLGTLHAANAAARTVTVWQSAYSTDKKEGDAKKYVKYKAKRAATMAMVPFANSSETAVKKLFPLFPAQIGDIFSGEVVDIGESLANSFTVADRYVYVTAYKRMLQEANSKDTSQAHPIIKSPRNGVVDGYIHNKYRYAAAATSVDYPKQVVAWNEDLKVTVKYRMAFQVPGTAKILGGKKPLLNQLFGGGMLCRDIETSVTIASEAAETEDKTVGIPYDPSLLRNLLSADSSGDVNINN